MLDDGYIHSLVKLRNSMALRPLTKGRGKLSLSPVAKLRVRLKLQPTAKARKVLRLNAMPKTRDLLRVETSRIAYAAFIRISKSVLWFGSENNLEQSYNLYSNTNWIIN